MNSERGPFFSNPIVARAARWGLLAWSVIGIVLLLWLVFRFVLVPIRVIFPPLVVALIVIYLLNPVVTTLQKRGVPRVWGALVTYVVFLSAVGVSLAYLVPVITHQVQAFVQGIPALLTRAEQGYASFARRLGLHLSAKEVFASFEPGKGGAFTFLGRLTSYTAGVVRAAVVLALGPLLAFYLLVDLPKIRRGAEALVPASRRDEVRDLAARINATLGGFFRGQLLVALLMGATSFLGYWFIGLPYFALMGALTGLLALVPLIGTVIAAIPVLFVAATADSTQRGVLHLHGGWPLSIGSIAVLVLVQQLDTRLLSRLVKREARLHPVTVLLSLLIGGTLIGLWGMLLAVPTAAIIKVLILHLWDTRATWPPRPASVPADVPDGSPSPGGPARDADGEAEPVERPRVRSV